MDHGCARIRRGVAAGLAAGILIAVVLAPRAGRAAGAAYAVDTADVSDPGSCKVESWVSSAANHDFIGAVSPACVIDAGRAVEVSSQFTRTRADSEWATGATPKIKTNIIPTAIGAWGFAVSGQASYDLITKENTALSATIPATLRLSDVARINLNGGWLWDRLADKHYLTYGAGFDLRTPDNVWTLTGEVFGQAANSAEEAGTVRPRFQAGLRWRPVDLFSVDLIYGRNLTGENSNWLTLATIVRFKPER